MEQYIKRMIEEYNQLKERTNKLEAMLGKSERGELDFELSCPVELLQTQYRLMAGYLKILEIRAHLEGIDLDD